MLHIITDRAEALLPPLHKIKSYEFFFSVLGLNGSTSTNVLGKFHRLFHKGEKCVIGSQIRNLFKDQLFESVMRVRKQYWKPLRLLGMIFYFILIILKGYLIIKLINLCGKLICNISLSMYFLRRFRLLPNKSR